GPPCTVFSLSTAMMDNHDQPTTQRTHDEHCFVAWEPCAREMISTAPVSNRQRRQSGTSARSRCRAPWVARQISRTRTYQMPLLNCPTWPTSTQPQSSPTLIL